ncbi:MAG: dihydroneopterin aldolase family protein [Promethearchaeota archaeon]
MKDFDENKYFSPDLSNRERATFEIGIKLGALYHIISGVPITSDKKVIESIEKGFEASISCQPYVKSVKLDIIKDKIEGNKSTELDYDEINGEKIKAMVTIEYKSIKVVAKIEWIDKLQYPLMFIEEIEES